MNESVNTILKFPFRFIFKYFLRNHVNYFKFHFCYILKERIIMINTRHHSKGSIYIYLFTYSTIQTTELGVLLALFYRGRKKDKKVREVKWFPKSHSLKVKELHLASKSISLITTLYCLSVFIDWTTIVEVQSIAKIEKWLNIATDIEVI